MRNIVINADDFGLTAGVSQAIVEALGEGAVSGTSVMVCAARAEDCVRQWLPEIRDRAGVHLQLTGGVPRLASGTVSSLCANDGTFLPRSEVARAEPRHVAAEWEAQLDTARSWGLEPTHLDSHHDVHHYPHILEVYLSLALASGLPVRGGPGHVRTRMDDLAVPGSRALVRRWTGRSTGCNGLLVELSGVLESTPEGEPVEIVSHPGYVDDDLHRLSVLIDARVADLTALRDLSRAGRLAKLGLRLRSHQAFSEDAAR